MVHFRQMVFLWLISLTGILWVGFLAWVAGYFLEGVMIAGLIIFTNLIVIAFHSRM